VVEMFRYFSADNGSFVLAGSLFFFFLFMEGILLALSPPPFLMPVIINRPPSICSLSEPESGRTFPLPLLGNCPFFLPLSLQERTFSLSFPGYVLALPQRTHRQFTGFRL